jgi:hypothetical protein
MDDILLDMPPTEVSASLWDDILLVDGLEAIFNPEDRESYYSMRLSNPCLYGCKTGRIPLSLADSISVMV